MKTIRKYMIGLAFVIVLSLINVTSIFAQDVNITDPVSGSTVTGTQYSLFQKDIDVEDGEAPYSYSISGTLPTGLSLEVAEDRRDADIIGVPTQSGSFTVDLIVFDSAEPPDTTDDTVRFTISITAYADDIVINVPDVFEITEGTVDESYGPLQFSTTDDTNEERFVWDIDEDDLPEGLAIDPATGQLIGIPRESGEFFFTVEVSDPDTGDTGTRDYKLTVTGGESTADLEISSPSSSNLPSGVLGRTYTVDVDATGGDGIYSFSASGLPSGLAISASTGIITGQPSAFGTFNVRITVEDGNDDTANRNYTLEIAETGDADYGSIPEPGATINFGDVNIGSSFTIVILVSEEGTDQLDVSVPTSGLIQGTDADNFTIITNSPPFSIADGGSDVTVGIRCLPDAEQDFNAILQFVTNDEDFPVVVYSLFCTGVTEGGNSDGGTDGGDTGGTAVPVATFTPSIPTQTPLPPTYANVIEVRGLSLRTGPFIGSSRRGVLRPDINYRITAKNNEEGVYMWYYVVTDEPGLEGWASGRYLAVYGQDVPVMGSVFDNVFTERFRGVVLTANDNLNFRPRPSDRMPPYPDLIPWGARLNLYARTASSRGDEWYAVEYNGVYGWVYADNTKIAEGLIDAIPKY